MASLFANIVAIVIAVLGSNGIGCLILKRKWEKEDNTSKQVKSLVESIKSVQEVCDVLLYHTLANKLEYYRVRGWATESERNEVQDLHNIYHKRGFNGNMDSRMQDFYDLPYEELEF